MQQYYLEIFIPVFALALNMLAQVFACRALPKLGLLKSEYFGFALGLASLITLEFFILCRSVAMPRQDAVAIFTANILIYGALGYGYFHFINLGETARRIRILRELYESPDGLTLQEILNRYNAKEILEKRMKRLIANGQVKYQDNRYTIGNPAMLLIAKVILAMKALVLGRK